MDRTSTSEKRIQVSEWWRIVRLRKSVLYLSFAGVFLVAILVTLFTPRQYLGKVQLEVLTPAQVGSAPGEASLHGEEALDRFTQTQLEALQAGKNLAHVVESQGLQDLWGLPSQEAAVEKLRAKVHVRTIPDTNLAAVEVYDQNPQMAADLANGIVASFQTRRAQANQDKQDQSDSKVESHLEAQQEKVDQAKAKLDALMNQEGATATAMKRSLSLSEEASLASSLSEAEAKVASLKSRLSEFQKLELEDFLQRASAANLADSSLKEMLPQYFNLRLTLRSLRDSGLGPKHPKVISVQNQVTETQALLSSIADNIQKTLQSDLKIAEEHYARLAEAQEQRQLAVANSEFAEAQSTFEDELAILQQMRASYTVNQVPKAAPPVLEVHEDAIAAGSPAQPRVLINLGLGALFGLGLGLGITFFLEYLDTSLKTVDQAERHLQLPVLAVIPSDVGVLHKEPSESPDSEAYRILRTNIDFNRPNSEANAITVVSGCAGEGKSTTLVNLAYVCAQSGLNTLIIDADLRRPRMHSLFNMDNERGLTDYLDRSATLQDVVVKTAWDHLFLLPSGALPADTSGLLSSPVMMELLADVKSRFDLVLVDAPPILGVSDASVLVNEVDMTMIVMQHRKLPRNVVLSVKQAVDTAGGRLMGVVMNQVDIRSHSQYQYYTNYYTYFSPERKAAKAKTRMTFPQADQPAAS